MPRKQTDDQRSDQEAEAIATAALRCERESGTCVMVHDTSRAPCTIENCNTVRTAVDGAKMSEPDLIRLRHANGVVVPRLDHIVAREHAVALLMKAGFKLHQVSQRSTSTYYMHPARAPYLLRVSDHPSKRDIMGLPNTAARLTISPKDKYLTELHIKNLVANAIGRYFMNDPKPSQYDGPKGTWENAVTT